MIVYVSIGNSDDKLTQKEWSAFWHEVNNLVASRRTTIHGRWMSAPNVEYQNACWCFEYDQNSDFQYGDLQDQLASCARRYNQDSIAWAVVSETKFL